MGSCIYDLVRLLRTRNAQRSIARGRYQTPYRRAMGSPSVRPHGDHSLRYLCLATSGAPRSAVAKRCYADRLILADADGPRGGIYRWPLTRQAFMGYDP